MGGEAHIAGVVPVMLLNLVLEILRLELVMLKMVMCWRWNGS